MIILLIGTDLAIIIKLYKMKGNNKKHISTTTFSRPGCEDFSPLYSLLQLNLWLLHQLW